MTATNNNSTAPMTGQAASLQEQNAILREQVFELLMQVAQLNEQAKKAAPVSNNELPGVQALRCATERRAMEEEAARKAAEAAIENKARLEGQAAQEQQREADEAERRADILDLALDEVRDILIDTFEELYGPDEASDTYETSFLLEHFTLITEDIKHPASSKAAPEPTYGRLLVDGITIVYRK
jgi:hypothetical protein